MERKYTILAVAVGVTLALGLVGAAVFALSTPLPAEIELSTAQLDLGSIPNTSPASQEVQVRNVGRGTLEISGVSTSCGCTTAEVASRRVAPGGTTALRVTFDPQAHDGATGRFMRQVYVRSNDPATPEATLTVWVTVVAP
jgi:hypothetical protein